MNARDKYQDMSINELMACILGCDDQEGKEETLTYLLDRLWQEEKR